MELQGIREVYHGKYLKQYELEYKNKSGCPKTYEIVSRQTVSEPDQLGKTVSGVSIIALNGRRLLLLHEFRMGVNRSIYNLCAGMLEPGETIENCVRRELYEDTGLSVKKIRRIFPPSYASVAISDVVTQFVLIDAAGEISSEHLSENEEIRPAFYTKEEASELFLTETFSSRAQLAAFCFTQGSFDKQDDLSDENKEMRIK